MGPFFFPRVKKISVDFSKDWKKWREVSASGECAVSVREDAAGR